MRPILFGTFDFTASGIEATELNVAIRQKDSSLIKIPGADGAYNGNGSRVANKQAGRATVRFELAATSTTTLDALLDAFLAHLANGAQTLTALHDDGSTRRVIAELMNVDYSVNHEGQFNLPVTAIFEIAEPYWYADTETTTPFTVTATPTACSLTNLGTAPLTKAIIRFTGTCNKPTWTNSTNGFSIQLNRNITSSKVVEINLGAQTVTYDGADDFANVVLSATQIGLFKFDVGANVIAFTAGGGGTPNGTVEYIYREMYG